MLLRQNGGRSLSSHGQIILVPRAYDLLVSGPMKGMTVISKNAQNGKISPKTHKNTPEVSQFYSFY